EREALELVAAVEEGELDQERHADDVAPELLDQPERRGHRAARGEQVIDGEYALPRLDRVLVDGERVAPVLELVLDLDGLARELAERPTSAAAQPTNFLAPMPRGVLRGTQLASFEGEASFDTRHPCCSRSKSTGSSNSPWSSSRPTGRSAEPARSSVYTGRSTGLPA